MIGLILQARMSSRRLPGKVMALLGDKPLLQHVVDQCKLAKISGPVVVCTSRESSDDPVHDYCKAHDIHVYRGALDNVYKRYLGCIEAFDLSAFGRICCDSPGISSHLIQLAVDTYQSHNQLQDTVDLVSNVCTRTFPVGQSIEIVNVKTFASEKFQQAQGFSQEHVTQTFYHNPLDYSVVSITKQLHDSEQNWGVDIPGDIERVALLLRNTGEYKYDKNTISMQKWSANSD